MKYYRSINGKPCEITEQETKEQERKNKELLEWVLRYINN